MKKRMILVLPAFLLSATGFAQNDQTDDDWENLFPHIVTEAEFTGRVGIGTQAPLAKLHITDVDQDGELGLILYRDQTASLAWPAVYSPLVDISTDNIPSGVGPVVNNAIFQINHGGKIGLGTRNQTAQLHMIKPTSIIPNFSHYLFKIESENHGYTSFGVTNNGVTHVGTPYNVSAVNQSTRALFEVWGMDNTALDMNTNFIASFYNWAGDGRVLRLKGGWEGSSTPIFQVEATSASDNYDENVRFRVLANGKVAIGDLDMNLPDGYRLYVDDGILTERLRVAVKNTGDWADYVFSDGYDLWTLPRIAGYIEEHCHLPGVPSAEEVVESGVDMVQMDALLLSKIEELTLHMIRLEQENQKLAGALQEMKASIRQ